MYPRIKPGEKKVYAHIQRRLERDGVDEAGEREEDHFTSGGTSLSRLYAGKKSFSSPLTYESGETAGGRERGQRKS